MEVGLHDIRSRFTPRVSLWTKEPIDQWLIRLSSDRVYSGSNLALVRIIFIFIKNVGRLTNPGKGNGKPPMQKFLQKYYNEEDTLHSNNRSSESSMALKEEDAQKRKKININDTLPHKLIYTAWKYKNNNDTAEKNLSGDL